MSIIIVTMSRATATRELCNVLKDQVFRIDEAVSAGKCKSVLRRYLVHQTNHEL